MLGHPDWKKAFIRIYAIFPEETLDTERDKLFDLIRTGQLPIAPQNIEVIPRKQDIEVRTIIAGKSRDADLSIVGIRSESVKHRGMEVFKGYEAIGNTLFVNASQEKQIK